LSTVKKTRLQLSRATDTEKKSRLGQFLTPERTAEFMASLFPDRTAQCRLLDAGAGIGSLSAAFLDLWLKGDLHFQRIEVDAFEIDHTLIKHLSRTLDSYNKKAGFLCNIHEEDFIHAAVASLTGNLFSKPLELYTHAILNPPYRKIKRDSAYRLALRRVGIETVNMYSAFVALATALAAPGGQIVAIIPRSFCNGPYYRPFREFILGRTAIRHMHLFESRSTTFRDDDVLQENVIIRLERGGKQDLVTISTSTDDSFDDIAVREYTFDKIVFSDDPEGFIHIPAMPPNNNDTISRSVRYRLADLGIKVSTGPVVDFRLREYLRDMPVQGTVPLLYPGHFNDGVTWPIEGMKKPNAILNNAETQKWLYPKGFYCVVRRFSSKEEKRRIVANVVEPYMFGGVSMLGFENHLNLFHDEKRGLPEALARGLAVFLNSAAVDENFRCFSGHTQVNATDLRLMKYPSRDALIRIGEWTMRHGMPAQDQIDARLGDLIE